MSAPVVIATLQKNPRQSLRVALTRYRDMDLIDVRVCVPLGCAAEVLSPTAKGVSLNVAMLPALVLALTAAETKARELGLIEESGG